MEESGDVSRRHAAPEWVLTPEAKSTDFNLESRMEWKRDITGRVVNPRIKLVEESRGNSPGPPRSR